MILYSKYCLKASNVLLVETTVYITLQDGRSIVFNVVNKRISHIKRKIEKSEKIPYDNHVLVYGGKKLEENKLLDDYNIHSFDELELVLSGQFYFTVLHKYNCVL